MIVCPNCQNQEITGAIFCSNCGTQLIPSMTKTQKITTKSINQQVDRDRPTVITPKIGPNSWVSLSLVENGQVLSVDERDEFTLGRVSDGQPIMPDLDLTSYNAYALGVSRLHCVVKKQGASAYVLDLGSTNGTFLNGIKLPAHSETLIKHGDVLALGKLKIQVLMNTD